MSALTPTAHASVRMAQRGISPKEAELIVLIGTQLDDGYYVTNANYQEVEHAMKRLMHQLKRVVGKRLIASSGQIVTAYHPDQRHQRLLMRTARKISAR